MSDYFEPEHTKWMFKNGSTVEFIGDGKEHKGYNYDFVWYYPEDWRLIYGSIVEDNESQDT
jgi:hypothetical protein